MITHEINYSNAVLREYLDKLHDLYHKRNETYRHVYSKEYRRNYELKIRKLEDYICLIKSVLQINPQISDDEFRHKLSIAKTYNYDDYLII